MILPYRNAPVCVFEDRPTVVIGIKVVWSREHGDDGGELISGRPTVHGVSMHSRPCISTRRMLKGTNHYNTLHLGLRAHE